jgi:hypothetical protein
MFFIPILFYSVVDKKNIRLVVYTLIFFTLIPFIEIERNFVYAYEDGAAVLNSDFSIVDVIIQSVSFEDNIRFTRTIAGFVGRLGGAQDVVLAYQYDNPLGNKILEFFSLEVVNGNVS